MSKLGESKLGSVQFATPPPFTPVDELAFERAEENMKRVFPTHEGTTWHGLLRTIVEEFELQGEETVKLFDERFVDTASHRQLDMIGDMWGLERREGEDDEHFRARIKLQLPRHMTTTTIDFIIDTSASLLRTRPERINVEENFDIEPARFDVFVEQIVMHDAGIEPDDVEEFIQDVKAAGVKARVTLGYQFTHRTVEDFEEDVNEEDKGYDDWDPETLHFEEPDEDDEEYGEGEYGSGPYGGEGVPLIDEEESELLGIGGPYADEITAEF